MEGSLEVVGEEEEGAEQSTTDQQRGQVGTASVAIDYDPERKQRMGRTELDGGEDGEERSRTGQKGHGDRCRPSVGPGHGEAVDEKEEPPGNGDRAGQVVAVLSYSPRLSRTTRRAATVARAAMGTLMRSVHRHDANLG